MNPEKTAKTRNAPSRPLQYLIAKKLIRGTVLDYGCGKGADYFYLKTVQKQARCWDPYFRLMSGKFEQVPNNCPWQGPKFDTILVTYVLNVLPPTERANVIEQVMTLLKPGGTAYFSVRADRVEGMPYLDGVITKSNTFQCRLDPAKLLAQIKGSSLVTKNSRYAIVSYKKPLK